MSIFGYSTYRKMKLLHTCIQPMSSENSSVHVRKRDRELLKMVLGGEVAVNLATLFPYAFIILETAIKTYIGVNKSIDHIRIESFLLSIASFLHLLNSTSHFYIFSAISKAFRKDVKQLIQSTW
ncbi:unnamed protein product [Rotaria magnacalcarata]|uniref:Uncharacterized protein n=1 Tax=Rotaria magnacalcarata TaxID=392030 RepID=A0A819CHJ9_9BILA|nr:unnamed protein product [Rotaria magnacalcarata]CAF2263910.1 unnamed protein product [Rotaria magnacalcarata]CAF3818178.1 unnamed protein product [Rotaria magnacalcarata]CAF4011087.1 unnamed protein product [Rotaria magnacalcarata]